MKSVFIVVMVMLLSFDMIDRCRNKGPSMSETAAIFLNGALIVLGVTAFFA